MKHKIVHLYEFSELSDEAKQKAIDEWYKYEDYPLLEMDLTESCKSLLRKNNIKHENLGIYYSLSYSQGDGLYFLGEFQWNDIKIEITHTGRYYFDGSADFEATDINGNFLNCNDLKLKNFKSIYLKICDELEKEGYGILEYRMDFNEMQELCEANGYYFLENGKMENE